MRINVLGLGYVGSVTIGCLSSLGHEVTGVDINLKKVEMISAGQSPIVEPGLDELISEGWKLGRIRAVGSTPEAVQSSEISIVCVGTPGRPEGGLDLAHVLQVCEEIGKSLSTLKNYHIVMVRSTLLPGNTEEMVIPVIEKSSGYKAGRDFGFCYVPEFLREGSALRDFFHPPFILIGRYDPRAASVAADLFREVEAPVKIVPIRTAEMVKYACNAFHSLKVAFANEIGNLCKGLGIDSHQVMDIFCSDRDLNLSSAYLRPGFAFGGSCLPKDLRALIELSHRLGLKLPLMEAILPSNRQQIQVGLGLIQQANKKKVGLLGLSFKAETDDLRESPLVELARLLNEQGYRLLIYDPMVSLSRLIGANKAYIEEKIPNLSALLCSSLEEVLNSSEVLVIGKKMEEFLSELPMIRKDQVVIDLARIAESLGDISARYQGICW